MIKIESDHGVCEHLEALVKFLNDTGGMRIWSERGDDGWVNVHCPVCRQTHEVVFADRDDSDDN